MPDLVWVTLASGLAGFIDAIVGGGGLVLVPALFTTFPTVAPATLFGTNKGAAIWGTAWSARLYARRVQMNWHTLGPAALAALMGAAAGAWLVTQVSPGGLRRALPLVLLGLLLYTLARKDLGRAHLPHRSPSVERQLGIAIGAGVGFYDGFFGPGTGSFLVFLLVRVLGYDFLHASAGAKLINVATNFAALAWFASTGHVMWTAALVMALANVAGSMLGTQLALQRGSGFVRGMFMLVVTVLIARTTYDAWLR
ncbi:MAG: sulfite exporter TauE/SafE family protein [Leptothrix sp. (in: b-proteobacteria)]